jgi:hypothetical protein
MTIQPGPMSIQSKCLISRECLSQMRQSLQALNQQVEFHAWTPELMEYYSHLLDSIAAMDLALYMVQTSATNGQGDKGEER